MYRTIHTQFWQDYKVSEVLEFDERYLFLYLLTNSHTNIIGCYELSKRAMSYDTGLSEKILDKALESLSKNGIARYDEGTREVLILNWHRYNWSSSPKTYTAIRKAIPTIKSREFAEYVVGLYNASENVTEPYELPSEKKEREPKHRHGQYDNVLLTDSELQKLKDQFPSDWQTRIDTLSGYIESKGAKYKSHYATIRNWARKDTKQAAGGVNDDALAEWL